MTVLLIIRFRKLPVATGAIRVRLTFSKFRAPKLFAQMPLPLLIAYLVSILRREPQQVEVSSQAIQLALLVLPFLQTPVRSAIGISVFILCSHIAAALSALQL